MAAPPVDHGPTLLDRTGVVAVDTDLFRAATAVQSGMARLFGGEVAARAVAAAQATLPSHLPAHSLHCYFLRAGQPGVPIDFRVTRLRDGRSFATRLVTAEQEGQPIFTVTASFHRAEPGPDGRVPFPPDVPAPAGATHHPTLFDAFPARRPFEIIELLPFRRTGGDDGTGVQRRAWIRTRDPLPDDPAAHIRAVTYVSDISTAFVPVRAAGMDPDPAVSMVTSLEHSLWVHRPVRADEWMLFEMSCVALGGARGLTRGTVHAADGSHVATFAQESLLRLRRPQP